MICSLAISTIWLIFCGILDSQYHFSFHWCLSAITPVSGTISNAGVSQSCGVSVLCLSGKDMNWTFCKPKQHVWCKIPWFHKHGCCKLHGRVSWSFWESNHLTLSYPSLESFSGICKKSSRHMTSCNQGTFSMEAERGPWERGCKFSPWEISLCRVWNCKPQHA